MWPELIRNLNPSYFDKKKTYSLWNKQFVLAVVTSCKRTHLVRGESKLWKFLVFGNGRWRSPPFILEIYYRNRVLLFVILISRCKTPTDWSDFGEFRPKTLQINLTDQFVNNYLSSWYISSITLCFHDWLCRLCILWRVFYYSMVDFVESCKWKRNWKLLPKCSKFSSKVY